MTGNQLISAVLFLTHGSRSNDSSLLDTLHKLMVESNYQRSQILPSEKAFAYKMRLEAMKRQGQRSDLTLSPVGTKFDRSSEAITEETGDSRNQIHRYIRLTNLVQELLDLVDEGKIKMRPAVELSYLDEDSQRAVVDEIDLNQCTPSHDQTIRMRKFFTEGKLTPEVVSAIIYSRIVWKFWGWSVRKGTAENILRVPIGCRSARWRRKRL